MTQREARGDSGSVQPAWTTVAAGWLMLALTAAYALIMMGAAVLAATDAESEPDQHRATVALVVLFVLLPVHVWAFLVGRGLLRRRPWARWAAVMTSSAFALTTIVPASIGGDIPTLLWASVALNVTVAVLAAHPATGRDLWWAEKARTRPDYVADRTAGRAT